MEVIDWSVPCYSVFASKQEIKEKYGVNAVRPLAKNTMRRVIRGVDKFTIKSGKPFIVPTGYGERQGQSPRVHDIQRPLSTVVSTVKQNLCRPVIAPLTFSNTGGSVGAGADEPVHTIRTAGGQILASASLMSIGQTGGGDRIREDLDPVPTVVSKQEACLVAASMIQYHTEQTEAVRANGMRLPLPTVDASNRYGLTCANLVEYYTGGRPLNVREPMHTITAHDREAVVCSHVVEFKGQDIGQDPQKPMRTITTSAGEFAACYTYLAKADVADLMHWPEVRKLLNEHCGYNLAHDEVLLLEIDGGYYFIGDILLRMLTPRELYNAMGFPPDYIIDHDYRGNVYGKTKQVARCGNAVCPPMATALVKANLPEWCSKVYSTMDEFEKAVAG